MCHFMCCVFFCLGGGGGKLKLYLLYFCVCGGILFLMYKGQLV